jgi:transcriptional regulator with XRE-family HTH domain
VLPDNEMTFPPLATNVSITSHRRTGAARKSPSCAGLLNCRRVQWSRAEDEDRAQRGSIDGADPLPDVASALAVFGGHLRRFRLRRGFTQEELAEHADVSRATVASLEQGLRSRPHIRTVAALADALQLGPVDRVAFMQLASAAPAHRNARRTLTPASAAQSATVHVRLPVPTTPLIGRESKLPTPVRCCTRRRVPSVC